MPSHRIDAEEFCRMPDGVVIDDAQVFNDELQERETATTIIAPHGGLGRQTPHKRLRQKTRAQVQPINVSPYLDASCIAG